MSVVDTFVFVGKVSARRGVHDGVRTTGYLSESR